MSTGSVSSLTTHNGLANHPADVSLQVELLYCNEKTMLRGAFVGVLSWLTSSNCGLLLDERRKHNCDLVLEEGVNPSTPSTVTIPSPSVHAPSIHRFV